MSVTPPPASKPRDGGRVVLWDAELPSRSPLFWPVADAMARVAVEMKRDAPAAEAAFPQPETIDRALAERAGIRFVRQRPVPRRRPRPRAPESMYDAQISREGCVPTRPGSWHDLMNALVWATFPLAKRALHARQHRLVVPALPGESVRRSRELDALALLDEGGLVVTRDRALGQLAAVGDRAGAEAQLEAELASGRATAFIFGHAIYEGITLGRSAPLASVVWVACPGTSGEGDSRRVAAADLALAAVLAEHDQLVEPRGMLRLRADDRLLPRGRR